MTLHAPLVPGNGIYSRQYHDLTLNFNGYLEETILAIKIVKSGQMEEHVLSFLFHKKIDPVIVPMLLNCLKYHYECSTISITSFLSRLVQGVLKWDRCKVDVFLG